MKNKIPLFVILFYSLSAISFTAIESKSILIKGKVKSEKKFELQDIQQLTLYTIGSVNIINHKGESKGKAKDLKGILLRDVLQQVALDTDNAKTFGEYYYVCKAADGYKVVYSWNELFNTAIGNKVFIVLERDGRNLAEDDDSFLMISPDDIRTGRRYLKNLEIIEVGRAA